MVADYQGGRAQGGIGNAIVARSDVAAMSTTSNALSLRSIEISPGAWFHDGLRQDPKAHHGVGDHQDQHRILAARRNAGISEHHVGRDMAYPYRNNVPGHDGNDRKIPDR